MEKAKLEMVVGVFVFTSAYCASRICRSSSSGNSRMIGLATSRSRGAVQQRLA
jgi:hypothetical protein